MFGIISIIYERDHATEFPFSTINSSTPVAFSPRPPCRPRFLFTPGRLERQVPRSIDILSGRMFYLFMLIHSLRRVVSPSSLSSENFISKPYPYTVLAIPVAPRFCQFHRDERRRTTFSLSTSTRNCASARKSGSFL